MRLHLFAYSSGRRGALLWRQDGAARADERWRPGVLCALPAVPHIRIPGDTLLLLTQAASFVLLVSAFLLPTLLLRLQNAVCLHCYYLICVLHCIQLALSCPVIQ